MSSNNFVIWQSCQSLQTIYILSVQSKETSLFILESNQIKTIIWKQIYSLSEMTSRKQGEGGSHFCNTTYDADEQV